MTLFVTLPIAVGGLGAWIANAQNSKKAVFAGMVANLIASLGFFAGGFEGAICIAMALPLALPLGALGGWLLYASTHRRVLANGAAMLAIVPPGVGTFGLDVTAKPKVFQVRSSVEIAAPPERVWKNVVTFSEIAPA